MKINITDESGASVEGSGRVDAILKVVFFVWGGALRDCKDAESLETLATAAASIMIETLQARGHPDEDIPELCREYAEWWLGCQDNGHDA